MKVECPGCGVGLNVDENKIPARGATAKCPKCGGPIRLEKPETTAPPKQDHLFHCPKCGAAQDKGTECISCGVVFDKIAPPPDPEPSSGPSPYHTEESPPLPPPPVPTRMLPAVLATIFCCLPTGVAALIYAGRVKGLEAAGDYDGAHRASRAAGVLSLASLVVGLVFMAVVGWFAQATITDFLADFGDRAEETEVAKDGDGAPESENQKSDGALPTYFRSLKNAKSMAEAQAIRSAFANLRAAQEMYFVEHGAYSSSIGGLASYWQPSGHIEIEMLSADHETWSAKIRFKRSERWFFLDKENGLDSL